MQAHHGNNTATDHAMPHEHHIADQTLRICPTCQKSFKAGELICSHCGTPFVLHGRTSKISNADTKTALPTVRPSGQVTSHNETPITLQNLQGQRLTFPVATTVVLGRNSQIPGDVQPDVHLNTFDAANQGVSRQHIKITRKNDLMYVSDLGSSNGTFLNGRPLLRNALRILRDGDELQLGMLKLLIGF
jgi:hypothetical protein